MQLEKNKELRLCEGTARNTQNVSAKQVTRKKKMGAEAYNYKKINCFIKVPASIKKV